MSIFLTQSFTSLQLPSSYKVPKDYVDCRQLLNIKLHGPTGHAKSQLKTQQKLKFKKKFYLQETIQTFKNTPSPNKYLEKYSTQKRYKSQSTFITKPNQSDTKLGKRPTWIEDIQKYQQKYKPPAAGKYNLLGQSDFSVPKKSLSLQKLIKNGVKFNNLDDTIFGSSQIPGPGSHNPNVSIFLQKKSVSKLKINPMTINMWKNKHKQDQKRSQKRLNLTKTSSFSYSPVKDKTFDSLSKSPKKESTLMKLTTIDKRKGLKSQIKSPGPGSHNIINQWATQTFKKQNINGNINLFSKTTRSLPSLRIYY